MRAKDKVFKYIDQNLAYERLEDVPIFTGGTRVVMIDSSFVVYYDINTNEIVELLPDGEKRTPWFIVSGEDSQGYYPAGVFEQNKPDESK